MKTIATNKINTGYLYLFFSELNNTFDSVGTIRYLITDKRAYDIEEKWLFSGVHEKGFYASIEKKDKGMFQTVILDGCKLHDDIWLCCDTAFKGLMAFYTIYTSKEALLSEPFMKKPKFWDKGIYKDKYVLTNNNGEVVYVALHIKLSECEKLDIKDLDNFEFMYFLWDNIEKKELGYSYNSDIIYELLSEPNRYTIEYVVRRKGLKLYYDSFSEEVVSNRKDGVVELLKYEFTNKDIAKHRLLE